MKRAVAIAKTAAAALGTAGLVLVALGLLFAAGELREGVRAACSAPTAGWLTRSTCRVFGVEKLTPVGPIRLEDTEDAREAERVVAPPCTTGQGLEHLVLEDDDLEQLEHELGRDVDGDGATGTVRPQAERIAAAKRGGAGGQEKGAAPPPTGELVLARKEVPPLPRGGTATATAPAAGGAVEIDLTPAAVPTSEWLHELELAGEVGLPIDGRTFGDELRLEGEWRFRRWRAVRVGIKGWVERPREEVRLLLGDDVLTGAVLRFSVLCRGLGDCEAK